MLCASNELSKRDTGLQCRAGTATCGFGKPLSQLPVLVPSPWNSIIHMMYSMLGLDSADLTTTLPTRLSRRGVNFRQPLFGLLWPFTSVQDA